MNINSIADGDFMVMRNNKVVLAVTMVSMVGLCSPMYAMEGTSTKKREQKRQQKIRQPQRPVETFTKKVEQNLKDAAIERALTENQLNFVLNNAKEKTGQHASFERIKNAKEFVTAQMEEPKFPKAQGEPLKAQVTHAAAVTSNQENDVDVAKLLAILQESRNVCNQMNTRADALVQQATAVNEVQNNQLVPVQSTMLVSNAVEKKDQKPVSRKAQPVRVYMHVEGQGLDTKTSFAFDRQTFKQFVNAASQFAVVPTNRAINQSNLIKVNTVVAVPNNNAQQVSFLITPQQYNYLASKVSTLQRLEMPNNTQLLKSIENQDQSRTIIELPQEQKQLVNNGAINQIESMSVNDNGDEELAQKTLRMAQESVQVLNQIVAKLDDMVAAQNETKNNVNDEQKSITHEQAIIPAVQIEQIVSNSDNEFRNSSNNSNTAKQEIVPEVNVEQENGNGSNNKLNSISNNSNAAQEDTPRRPAPRIDHQALAAANQPAVVVDESNEPDWIRNQNLEKTFTEAPVLRQLSKEELFALAQKTPVPTDDKGLDDGKSKKQDQQVPPLDPVNPADPAGNPSKQKIKTPFFKNPWLYVGAMTAVPVAYALYNIIQLAKNPIALKNHEIALNNLIKTAKTNNVVGLQEQLNLSQEHLTVIGKEKMSQLREFAHRGQMPEFIKLAESCKKEIAEIIAPAQKAFSKEAMVKVLKRIKLGVLDEVEALKLWVAKRATAAKVDKSPAQRA